jgi:hypothetical protein
MWKRIVIYGACLAFGTLLLQGLDYWRLVRQHTGDIYIVLIATAFLALGVFAGAKLFGGPKPAPFDGNPKAVNTLGISPRELTVLKEIAAGRSTKEIARVLEVSPNTVKTPGYSKSSKPPAVPTPSTRPESWELCLNKNLSSPA